MSPETPSLVFSIDSQQGIIFVDLLDLSSPDELLQRVSAITEHWAYRHTHDVLVDCSRLAFVPSLGVVASYAELFRRYVNLHLGHIAIAGHSRAGYGVARAFEVLSGADLAHVCAFRSTAEALAWLEMGPRLIHEHLAASMEATHAGDSALSA